MIKPKNKEDPSIEFIRDEYPIRPPEQVMSIDRCQPDIDIAKFSEYDDQMLNRFDI
jgi:hypothetical protein